jgi:hypothetical protein
MLQRAERSFWLYASEMDGARAAELDNENSDQLRKLWGPRLIATAPPAFAAGEHVGVIVNLRLGFDDVCSHGRQT